MLAGFFLVAGSAWASGVNTDYGAGSDYRQGAGARAAGMGGAFTAVADDATAGYWNPAGLSQMEIYDYEAGLQYIFLPNDVSSSYLTYAFQVPETGSFGFSWMNLTVEGIEGRDEQELPVGDFGSSENMFWLSFGAKAYRLARGFSWGGNLKLLQHSLKSSSAVGWGMDLGVLWYPNLSYDHSVGIVLQNIGQKLYWNTTGKTVDESALTAKIGFAFRFLRSQDEIYFTRLNTALDLEITDRGWFAVRAGGEYWFVQSVGVRAGFAGQELTVGASYRPDVYEVCYAYIYDLSVNSANQHRFSLNLRFR